MFNKQPTTLYSCNCCKSITTTRFTVCNAGLTTLAIPDGLCKPCAEELSNLLWTVEYQRMAEARLTEEQEKERRKALVSEYYTNLKEKANV